MKDYQEQVKQMLKDLAKEKEKDAEKPLPHMNQVPRTPYDLGAPRFSILNRKHLNILVMLL